MKKTFLLVAGSLFLMVSCTTKKEGGMSDSETKNLEAARKVADAFKTGNVAVIDSVVADDFIDHTERGDMNRDSLKAMIRMAQNQQMDIKMIREFSEGDYVYQWNRYSGTSDGSMGMPKGPYDFACIEVVRFNNNNKAVEHWAMMEPRDVMKMMSPGSAPDMNNPMPMDTTKKDTTKHY